VRILTEGYNGPTAFDPEVKKVNIHMPPVELGSKQFDLENLTAALAEREYVVDEYGIGVVRMLAQRKRDTEASTTAVLDRRRLLAVESGDTTSECYGVAVDIGTTTLAAKLIDLSNGDVLAVETAVNPQATHGADVVARIKYTLEHKGGLQQLHRLITREINQLLIKLPTSAGVSVEHIYKVVLVGNTVMLHLALMVDPRHMGSQPYTPTFQGPIWLDSSSIGLKINPHGMVYGLPHLAGFVGSDITSVLTVLDLDESENIQLVIDMGTNGEMVLGSRERLLCCSSPAGPAWEGASITNGMPAMRGAIERAEIKGDDLVIQTVGGDAPVGICGSGLIDLVCEGLRAGLILSSGRISDPENLESRIPRALQQRIRLSNNNERAISITNLDEDRSIVLTQRDIREIQLAKGAIAAGIDLMMQELSIRPDQISRAFIAGAFGNHIRGQDVVDLGLIPGLPADRISFIGNAALSGAEAVLLSREKRLKAEALAVKLDYIEIADRPDFQKRFVKALQFSI